MHKIKCLLFLLSLLVPLTVFSFSGGDGSEADPYQITTAAELDSVRYFLRSSFIVMNAIDLGVAPYDTGKGWQPIGYIDNWNTRQFKGHFNGRGNEIQNLFIQRDSTERMALFCWTDSAVVESVSVVNCSTSGDIQVSSLIGYCMNTTVSYCHGSGTFTGNSHIGGLVAYNHNGIIINCSSSGKVSGNYYLGGLTSGNMGKITESYSTCTVEGGSACGGLVGESSGSISHCYATGNVTGGQSTGGLAGGNTDTISDCYALGNVEGSVSTGGLIGTNGVGNDTTSLVINCHAKGSVNVSSNTGGGLIGCKYYGTVSHCYAMGDVIGGSGLGGLIGASGMLVNQSDSVIHCYATGDVEATGQTGVAGGLIGDNKDIVSYCYATGTVKGTNYIGGLVGSSTNAISFCYATGNVYGTTYVGGLIGGNYNPVAYCYATGDVSANMYAGGLLSIQDTNTVTHCYSSGKVSGTVRIGGLIGFHMTTSPVKVTACYWDTVTSQVNVSSGGTGQSTAIMKKQATFAGAGWDFNTNWEIREDSTYPGLKAINDVPFIFAVTKKDLYPNTSDTSQVYICDVDGTVLSDSVSAPYNGTATFSNMKLIYTPTAGWAGQDSVTIVAMDNDSGVNKKGIAYSVNDSTPIVFKDMKSVSTSLPEIAVAPNPARLSDGYAIIQVGTENPYHIKKVMILDALGNVVCDRKNLVRRNKSQQFTWNLCNKNGRHVSSGTYVILIDLCHSDGTLVQVSEMIGVVE